MARQLADFPGAAMLLEHIHGKLLPKPLTTVTLHHKELRHAVLALGQVMMRIDQGEAHEISNQLGQERIAPPLGPIMIQIGIAKFAVFVQVGVTPDATVD